jgi:acetyl-CoA carboxylase carboxyltransferase component
LQTAIVGNGLMMSWKPELDELKRRQAFAQKMGGEEKVARHRKAGKLTVRERIDAFLDPGSFQELGSVAGAASYDDDGKLTDLVAANHVLGRGRIASRPVVIGADDFTVRGGANEGGVYAKLIMGERMAQDLRLPMIRLVDGTGGGGSVKTIENSGRTYVPAMLGWHVVIENMGVIPVVGLALGSVAGLGAARVAHSHYSLMVRATAQMFAAGPPVVARVEKAVDKEQLGGSRIHTRNGSVDDEVASEAEAFERTRRFLSYLPSSVYELPLRAEPTDDPNRQDENLIDVVPREPRKVYKMRTIIESVVDTDSWFEIGKMWGRSIITGFARLDGWPVAIIASDPYHYAGAWTAKAAEKLTRFADLAQTFHLPVVHLADIPGFHIGVDAEEAATIRYGVRAMAAIEQSTVPWCTILIRRVFGVAGAAHQPHGRFAMRYAWPSGEWGSLPIAGGLEAAYKAELENAPDRAAKLAEIEGRLKKLTSPFRTAETFLVEEIIDPRRTRSILCEFANLAAPLRTTGPSTFTMRP